MFDDVWQVDYQNNTYSSHLEDLFNMMDEIEERMNARRESRSQSGANKSRTGGARSTSSSEKDFGRSSQNTSPPRGSSGAKNTDSRSGSGNSTASSKNRSTQGQSSNRSDSTSDNQLQKQFSRQG
ncbi:MAG: hypothetical protein SFT81_02935 [Candidatus Caenarcaniphilales bacterium]|nr:hypothetical protein [Candidatus Caenarcaniphilales bacterium]